MAVSKEHVLKKFGERIKYLRKVSSFSQEGFADKVGIHRTYMGRIERGESNPPIFTVYKIVKALKIKPTEFLSL